MNKILAVIGEIWNELDSVVELFVYLGIAYGISKMFSLTYIQSLIIVCVYFVLNLLRLLVEAFRNRSR